MRCHDNEVSLFWRSSISSILRASRRPRRLHVSFSEAKARSGHNFLCARYISLIELAQNFPVRRCACSWNVGITCAPLLHHHVLVFQADNGGLVMVTFYNYFVKCGPEASVSDVAEHIYYIRNLIGVDHIGVGGDFDGINKYVIN